MPDELSLVTNQRTHADHAAVLGVGGIVER
jgi:hypothetical protein